MSVEIYRDSEKRGDGKLPILFVNSDTLGEASHKAICACYYNGARVETPKHKENGTLGYDADILVRINNPDSEEHIYKHGTTQTGVGMMEYILAVTHGIHNHRKKSIEHPEWWGYTYNERIVDQLPFVFQRIKSDWNEKQRITGRDYQFTTWRPGEDIILEQEDPPCWQSGQLRFLENEEGEIVMNYLTHWRSRDLLKAWTDNNVAQIELMKLLKNKVSDTIGIPIKLGAYIDHSQSLHLYGAYLDDKNVKEQIKVIANGFHDDNHVNLNSFNLNDYIIYMGDDEINNMEEAKTLIATQLDAESKGYGLQQKRPQLEKLGYDFSEINYPKEWDTWPASWNAEPNLDLLARVLK